MGTIDEECARKLIIEQFVDNNAVILDDFIKENGIKGLGFAGGRFPLFDISSATEVCSVTARNSIAGYLTKFQKMFNVQDIERAAQDLFNLAQMGCPIPIVLIGEPLSVYKTYLMEKSVFRIPENHFLGMRTVIMEELISIPSRYWLRKDVTCDELKAIVNQRIQSSGFHYDTELKEERLVKLYRSLL